MASEYRCVGCGFKVKSLFIQYSPGNIRLMKCGNCKDVADEYIECERMIIFIDLILHRPKVLLDVLSANAAFIFSFVIVAKGLLNEVSRRREIVLGILISSYFKIFLLAMLVWEFPMSVIFIVDVLVLTSNSMALKVMTEATTSRCIAVCLVAHLVRFLVCDLLYVKF